ncbi:unnamed protein product [marine sediment metagenome]|uniref:Uncharacterized protein n=1 Tax=marine sediment metagenome TaxID=412755 RepID=X0ZD70_9ZZZZ
MKTEDEIQVLNGILQRLDDAPEWFIDKHDLDIVQKTIAWILGD